MFKRKWKPNAAQRKAFAERMNNPDEQKEYEERKLLSKQRKRANSRFDYSTAGGYYIPVQEQYLAAMELLKIVSLSMEQITACDRVIAGYISKEAIHHDFIHIVNELRREQKRMRRL